jgi:hypothetical protein
MPRKCIDQMPTPPSARPDSAALNQLTWPLRVPVTLGATHSAV